MNSQARYTLPAGTLVLIRGIRETEWRDYETRKTLEFERYDTRNKAGRFYEFRFENYLIRARNKDLLFRERERA